MKVLLCGANGFVGRHVEAALLEAGHQVVRGVSRAGQSTSTEEVVVDFAADTNAAAWHDKLQGIGAVVNAVGVLRNSRSRPLQAVHASAPAALFDACALAGIRRVIHVSALGIENSNTPYATTKRQAEQHLLSLNAQGLLDGVVLRPSVVFGQGGESSDMFLALARLPVMVLPQPAIRARIQPVHALELAEAVARLLAPGAALRGIVECTGPESVPLSDFIASLRRQRGGSAPRVLAIPDWLTRLSARLGDAIPVSPWGTQALALLSQDNVGSPQAMTQLLGRAPSHYSELLAATVSAPCPSSARSQSRPATAP